MRRFLTISVMLLSTALAYNASANILDDVRGRGAVNCGVNQKLAGFASANSLGEYSGFDVDLCRAVASAIFNDSEAVEYIPVTIVTRFLALQSGDLDILSRNTTWTLERNASFGDFVGISFFDGQGFMIRKGSGIRSALELDNKPICVATDTTSELNAADFFTLNEMRYRPVYYDDDARALQGYVRNECAALTADRSTLAAQRSTTRQPDSHSILPEVFSKEPLGPAVPPNNSEWENVVRWSLYCMINAEELGVNRNNIDNPSIGTTPAIRRLIGIDGDTGAALGLNAQWCARIIRQIGNYGEVYERHLGPDTPIGLPRGINAIWTNGGLLFAPPVR